MLIWKAEKRKISELVVAGYNPRKLTEKQSTDLKASLDKFNLADPIVINKDNKIIGGHQRINILKEKGDETVDVRVPDRQLTETEEKELNLRLNRNLGDWDFDKLGEFGEDMLLDVGFDSNEVDMILDVQEDEFDAEKEYEKISEPITKKGDIYVLGNHRLMCGDSTKDLSKLMVNNKARLIFTDPPYNVNYKSQSGNSYSEGKYNGQKIFNDNKSDEDCLRFYIDILLEMKQHTMDDCCIYWWLAFNSNGLINLLAFKEAGWKMSEQITWVKEQMVFSRGQDYHRMSEPCFFGWKEGKTHFTNKKISNLKDVFSLKFDDFQDMLSIWFERRDKIIEYKHPTQKPVRLAERALRKNSQIDDIVLDVFGGSGSTLMACEQMNRKCYMMELDPKYCDVIIKRWEQYTNKRATKATEMVSV